MRTEVSDPIDVAVGRRIRIIRMWRGSSQHDLAMALGVTHQQVQKYETGVNRISASMIRRAAAFLQTPVGVFFGDKQGDAWLDGEAGDLLTENGAIELLKAYAAMRSPQSRRLLVQLLQGLPQDYPPAAQAQAR